VLVAEAVQKPVPRQIRTFGSAEAYATVVIKSQVAGQVTRAHIVPGQAVKAGELLFSIDARPFEAELKQLEAVLARNRVLAAESERQAKIAAELTQRKVASNDEMARAQAAAAAQQAALLVDQANIDRVRLDLEYCTIKAPITGRTGDLLTREGSVVKANDVNLVEVAQTVPIYVSFAVPQVHLPDIRRFLAAGSVEVTAAIPGDTAAPAVGKLDFIDNTVDESTGTIRLKALFENAAEQFWPGEFLDVVLTLTREEQGVVIPYQALQHGQGGTIAFVVKPDQTVELRRVTVRRTLGDEALIGDGVQAGETVVTDGQLRLVPGARIEVANGGGPGPGAASPADGARPPSVPAGAATEQAKDGTGTGGGADAGAEARTARP
jgi:multidrug efflux system membrane fusion protein